MKEIAAELHSPLNCVSGRRSGLEAKGLIEGTGQRRGNSEVLVRIVRGQQSLFDTEAA